MTPQQSLDFGRTLKEKGMRKAVDHANQVHQDWSDRAYEYMIDFVYCVGEPFLAEDVRNASKGLVPVPPSARAWGSIIVRAAKAGLIKKIGYGQVKNAKAHRANAALWQRV